MHPKTFTVYELFNSQTNYIVPHFQRFYVWKMESQWEPLWEDIVALATNFLCEKQNMPPHFMGAIVLKHQKSETGEPAKCIIVDGQQRLTTLQILIVAVARALLLLSEDKKLWSQEQKDELDRISNGMLSHTTNANVLSQEDKKYKIHHFIDDFKIFKQIISGDSDMSAHTMNECYDFFLKKTREWLLSDANNIISKSEALERSIFHSIRFCVIDLDEDEDENDIFETLNARAEPLSEWDKAKNHLIAKSSDASNDQNDFYRKYIEIYDKDPWWREEISEARFEGSRINRLFSHWVRIELSHKIEESITDRRLYHHFRNDLVSGREPVLIAESLNKFSKIYKEFEMYPEDNSVQGIFSYRRKSLNAGVITPLIMSITDASRNEDSLNLCIRVIESYLVRRVIAGHNARAYNKIVFSLINEVASSDNSETIPRKIIDNLSERISRTDRWPNNEKIYESIENTPIYGSISVRRIKMILEAIDRHITSHMAGSKPNYNDLQIEHIMPQDWEDHWPALSPDRNEERVVAINSLGNLTLVHPSFNASLSNKSWNDKRTEFIKHENLFINSNLLDCTLNDWNEQTIQDRGRKMAKIICEIWPHADDFIAELAS